MGYCAECCDEPSKYYVFDVEAVDADGRKTTIAGDDWNPPKYTTNDPDEILCDHGRDIVETMERMGATSCQVICYDYETTDIVSVDDYDIDDVAWTYLLEMRRQINRHDVGAKEDYEAMKAWYDAYTGDILA